MNITLFSKIVKQLRDQDFCDFECTIDSKIYSFKDVSKNDSWDDQGKYQYQYQEGQLIETDENYKEIQSFNFGVTRTVQRSGSYFSDYYYSNYPYDFFEIKEVIVPEQIITIPTHIENKWEKLKIDLLNIVDEEEEERKRIEIEKIRLEEEIKLEIKRFAELYSMNRQDIIQKVNKNLRKKGETFTITNMRKEYFNIVVAENLESQEWINYHRNLQEDK